MRPIKALITAAAAAVCMMSCCPACFAEGEDNYVVTTTIGTSVKGDNGVVWTQITENKPINGLDNNAVHLDINVSNIEDNKFTAVLDIKTKEKIASFSGSIGYNSSDYRLVSAQLADGDSGVLTDEKNEGRYSFNYSNEAGSDRSGGYITLSFEMIKDSKKDDILFLTVDSILDMQSESMGFNKTDGIISSTASPEISQDVKTLKLAAFARPYTFEELGFENIINCEMEQGDAAKYSEGGIVAMTPGTVEAKLISNDYTIQKVKIEVYRADGGDGAAAEKQEDKEKAVAKKAKLSVNLGVPLLLCVALVFAEYLVILKPKKKRPAPVRSSNGSFEPRYQQRYPSQRRDPRNYRK